MPFFSLALPEGNKDGRMRYVCIIRIYSTLAFCSIEIKDIYTSYICEMKFVPLLNISLYIVRLKVFFFVYLLTVLLNW